MHIFGLDVNWPDPGQVKMTEQETSPKFRAEERVCPVVHAALLNEKIKGHWPSA